MADWCKSHPRYSAKKTPGSLCGSCWALWFLKNPEDWRNTTSFKAELAITRSLLEVKP